MLSFPPLTFTLFVITPWALYFSGWYPATLHHDYLHEMTHLHMVVVGCLFFWPLMGVDPLPGRITYPARMLLTVLTLPFHAFMGVTIMAQDRLIGGAGTPSSTTGPMGSWLPSPHADQVLAGGILWSSGDAIGLLFFAVLFVQWVRSSTAEAKREDRRLDLLEAREARAAAAAPRSRSGRHRPAAVVGSSLGTRPTRTTTGSLLPVSDSHDAGPGHDRRSRGCACWSTATTSTCGSRSSSRWAAVPTPTCPSSTYVEVATEPVVLQNMDAGGIDLAILDGEAAPAGGMGIAKQLKDEIYRCPPILVLIGRPQDAWLATWSRAEAAVPHPIDPVRLAEAVTTLLRPRVPATTSSS